MPIKITAWQCQYCSRYRINKASITRHEQICFSNPNRKILDGQLAIFDTMPRELLITDSYGVPNSDWIEPMWTPDKHLLEKYKWWPINEDGELGLGYIYQKGAWHKIKRYKPPHFAPGFAWRDEFIPEDIIT